MKKIILSNLGLKILSVILGISLWLVVANTEDPVTMKQYKDVPVQIKNESAINSLNKVYEIKSGATADFSVKGRRSVLDNMTSKDYKVTADLSHLSEVNSVQVDISPKDTEKNVEIFKNSNILTVSLEDEKEQSFSVNMNTQGKAANGYAMGEYTISPNIIDVKGPKSLINRIDTVSINVDIANARQNFTKDYHVHYYDSDGEEIDNTRIESNANKVSASIKILRTKEITVSVNTIGQPAKGYDVESVNYEPQTVVIAGTKEQLERVNQISINDVDISGITSDKEYSFKVSSYLPEDIVLTDPEQKIMVKVDIGQMATRTMIVSESDINLDGSIPSYQYKVDKNTKVELKITGFYDNIMKLEPRDLEPMISVSGLAEGSYNCSLEILEPENTTITISGKVKVDVKRQ